MARVDIEIERSYGDREQDIRHKTEEVKSLAFVFCAFFSIMAVVAVILIVFHR